MSNYPFETFPLTKKIGIVNPISNLDARYGPWLTLNDALTSFSPLVRELGLTVAISADEGIVEYWYKNGITDSDLVLKEETVVKDFLVTDSLTATTMFTTGSGNVIIDRGNYRRNSDPTIIIGTNSDQHLRFRAGGDTNNEIRMTILSSGEVGIGTNLTQTVAAGSGGLAIKNNLTVGGSVSATNVITNTLTVPVSVINLTTTTTFDGTDTNKIFHFDTTTQPLCAIFPSTLPDGFNVAVMNTGTNNLRLSAEQLNSVGVVIGVQYGGAFVYKDNNQLFAVGRL